jgi:hypothetical protein
MLVGTVIIGRIRPRILLSAQIRTYFMSIYVKYSNKYERFS